MGAVLEQLPYIKGRSGCSQLLLVKNTQGFPVGLGLGTGPAADSLNGGWCTGRGIMTSTLGSLIFHCGLSSGLLSSLM